MLGGKIIVLESKDVALRNRNGEELEERVVEFQNRVKMLLSDKENISNIKNVSIHQLIALKAYILELDSKIKSLANENEYCNKKYRSYKEKYLNIQKRFKSYDGVIGGYRNKIAGYDRLFLKMQEQLERAINAQDAEINTISTEMIHVEQYRRKVHSMREKLQLQEKYKKQELETIKLNYDTQIMELTIQLDNLRNIEDTLALYKQKNHSMAEQLI